jgi:transposase
MRAVQFFEDGFNQADVHRLTKVSRQSVSRWFASWKKGGKRALRAAGRAGRKPKLDKAQIAIVEKSLLAGPHIAGYKTEIWTLPRIAKLIRSTTGVQFHPGHVWRLLRQLGWSLQKPARRAVERDERAVQRWIRSDWPRLKKTPCG